MGQYENNGITEQGAVEPWEERWVLDVSIVNANIISSEDNTCDMQMLVFSCPNTIFY